MMKNYIALFLMTLVIALSCKNQVVEKIADPAEKTKKEKNAIIEVIRNETIAAFQRDYEAWQSNWIQKPYISKTYINFADNSSSETLGWQKIDDFVRTYIQEHPEPVPPPAQPEELEVRLYGSGAWVRYDIIDEVFGLKRETRLMEKEDGQWKIAGMHTTIYGFEKKEE